MNKDKLNAKLELLANSTDDKELHLGYPYSFKLTIWPIDPAKEIDSSVWQHNLLDNVLYIYDIENLGSSVYNEYARGFHIKGVFVKKVSNMELMLLPMNNDTVPVIFDLPLFSSEVMPELQNYFYKDLPVDYPFYQSINRFTYYTLGIGVITLITIILLRSKLVKWAAKSYWLTFLKKEKSRAHWELIFAKQAQWKKYLLKGQHKCKDFLDYLDSIQYKKDWTSLDESMLHEHFNEFIRFY